MIRTLITLLLITFNTYSQDCNDVTKEVTKILKSQSVEIYDAQILGACIDHNNILNSQLQSIHNIN